MQRLILIISLFILVSGAPQAVAQSREDIANLIQDVAILREEVSRLRFDMQTLQREKARLEAGLMEANTSREAVAQQVAILRADTQKRLNDMRADLMDATEQQKTQIIANVTSQIEQLVLEMERAFKELQGNVAPHDTTSAPNEKKTFDDNFPKTGIEYTVKKGDNLWKIAQEYQSKVSWIQNANRIAKASQLQVGQVLFVPQKQ